MVSLEQSLVLITSNNGNIYLGLIKRTHEPYLNMWTIPSINYYEDLNSNIEELINKLKLKNVYYKDSKAYTKARDKEITINYLAIIDYASKAYMSSDYLEWFDINKLPKLAYQDIDIIRDSINDLRDDAINSNTLAKLFPSDFTIPELMRFFENLYGTSYDRRNFKKKLEVLNLIDKTGNVTSAGKGRPAKLYKFKQGKNVKIIF